MLIIKVPPLEGWDEAKEEFVKLPGGTLRLEHSLISISKWEAKWHTAFFDTEKTEEQIISYIKCMSLNSEEKEDQRLFSRLTVENIDAIKNYLEDPMTATTIKETPGSRSNQRVTSELIYCWMIQFNIPHEFEKWHISRLITLIRVCSEENKPKKKMSRNEIMAQNKAINAARRAKHHTRG